MRLISEGWPHIFVGFGERIVRFVYDVDSQLVTHMQISSNGRWADATQDQMLDVSRDVADNLNIMSADMLGLELVEDLPDWVITN